MDSARCSASTSTGKELPEDLRAEIENEIASGTFRLPVLPEIATKILTATENNFEDIVRGVKRDQVLAAHVLRIANSAIYRAKTAVSSIDQAVVRLGLVNMRQIVISIICREKVFRVPGHEDDMREMFEHSIRAAMCALAVADLRGADPEVAFVTGLLHDIGRPILLERLARVEKERKKKFPKDILFGTINRYHCEVGGALTRAWNFPPFISHAIANHHAVLGPSVHEPLVSLLQLADAMSRPDEIERRDSLILFKCEQQEINYLVDRRDSIDVAVQCFS